MTNREVAVNNEKQAEGGQTTAGDLQSRAAPVQEVEVTPRYLQVLNPKKQELASWNGEGYKKEIPKYWDRDEINGWLEQIKNYKHKMFLKFLWLSGVRVTEAVSLRKKDIDFKHYVMRVRWLKSRKYVERVLPMHPNLKNMLEMYVGGMNQEAYVFPFTRQQGWAIAKKWTEGHPHKFRHSFAVNWLRCGGDIVVLHLILGHANIQTTMEYLKIVPMDQGKELLKIKFD